VRRKIVLGIAAVGSAACAFVIGVLVHKGLADAGVWAGVVGALAGVVAAAAALWGVVPRASKVPLPPEFEALDWMVSRPEELTTIVRALVGGRARTVGITTGLYGAGGFGKTTLAQMACADRRVRRRFGRRVYLVTVGRDLQGSAAVAAKINDLIKLVTDQDASFTDPQLAGQRLGSLLDAGPRRLLVLDDVWDAEQLAPFTKGGRTCVRLVTTRVPELITGRDTAVRVDQMSPEQARALLTAGLPPMDPAVVAGLLAVTGRWPLLLRLVSQVLTSYAQVAENASAVSVQGALLVDQLTAGGPAVVDELRGDGRRDLDVGQPDQRARAVRATIEASTGLLDDEEVKRFTELGVFAADETIPFQLVATLWRATAGLDDLRAAQMCKRLAQLALVSQASPPVRGISLHDVIRDFLRAELGLKRLAKLNVVFLNEIAAHLPAVSPPASYAAESLAGVAWWDLKQEDRYLWDHLIEHVIEAERSSDAEAVACDLRWVGARLIRFGPAAPTADLTTAGTPAAATLRSLLARAAHLLAPTEPAEAVVDVLHSRLDNRTSPWPAPTAPWETYSRPRLANWWPLPDLADPAFRRVLVGHASRVNAVAVAPDGSWLASGGDDATVRIWDRETGRQRTVLEGHASRVNAVAVAPDGSWLASGGDDATVRSWDRETGRQRRTLVGHLGAARAVAMAPDGSWLATGDDGAVRIWNPETGQQRPFLVNQITSPMNAVAVGPDGNWLASGSGDAMIRIWDVATRREQVALKGHTDAVRAAAVAPDGSWLTSGGDDTTVRIWDTETRRQQRSAAARDTTWVNAVAVAPDGNWLASADADATVRIWDVTNAWQSHTLRGHTDAVRAVAVAPDGSWLASGGGDRTMRIWKLQQREQTEPIFYGGYDDEGDEHTVIYKWWQTTNWLEGHTGAVQTVAVSSDGSLLASGSDDCTIRIWDPKTGRQRTILKGHTSRVNAVAVAPNGSWLTSGGDDGTVRTWSASGRPQAILIGHTNAVRAVAVAPDGNWLASAGDDTTMRIWEAATGQALAVLKYQTSRVNAVAVAPDGRWLASVSSDNTVRICDTHSWQARALMRVDSNITTCAWRGSDALVVGGSAGLYLFQFFTGDQSEHHSAAATLFNKLHE
jgi:WD40 repeat protein